MALIESLGYKQDSTPQRRKASRQETLLSDFSMTPYGAQMGSSAAASRENSHLLSNRPVARSRGRDALVQAGQAGQTGQTGQTGQAGQGRTGHSKYGALPTKSLRSSGIGAVSPMPKRLELAQHDCTMPISPIRASEALQQSQSSNFVAMDSQNMNMTSNTLNFSHMKQSQSQVQLQAQGQGQGAQAAHLQGVQHETQVTIIGFPPGEAAFIHRKFGSYGCVVNSEWSDNALFLEYEHRQNALRALAENAKWISNANERYMIAVTYAELTELNGAGQSQSARRGGGGGGAEDSHSHRGRFLSLGPDNGSLAAGQQRQHFGRHLANVEKAPAIQFGPTHILWKVFNFVTSGW